MPPRNCDKPHRSGDLLSLERQSGSSYIREPKLLIGRSAPDLENLPTDSVSPPQFKSSCHRHYLLHNGTMAQWHNGTMATSRADWPVCCSGVREIALPTCILVASNYLPENYPPSPTPCQRWRTSSFTRFPQGLTASCGKWSASHSESREKVDQS